MTAISLYISTCRYVMQADTTDRDSWTDLYRFLPCLRQALSCCVCGNIISKPRGPSHNECLHNVCTHCVGGKMRLKPSCSWCKDYIDFRDNTHLRILVLCFRKLCEYIYHTQIWSELTASSANGETNPLVSIVNEALQFEDDYVTNTQIPNLASSMPILTPAAIKPIQKRRGSHRQSGDDISEASSQGPPTLSPECETNPFDKSSKNSIDLVNKVSKEDKCDTDPSQTGDMGPPPLFENSCKSPDTTSGRSRHSSGRIGKEPKHEGDSEGRARAWKSQRSSSHDIPFEPPSKRTRAASLPSGSELSRKICRCARNNPPNRLTCLGQRCPCYSSRVPCVGCMCRGCRNPRKFEDVDVTLELEGGRSDIEQENDIDVE